MDNLECRIGTQPELDIQLSQAISLKRIADALEKLLVVPTIPELTPERQEEWEKANKNAGFMEYKR